MHCEVESHTYPDRIPLKRMIHALNFGEFIKIIIKIELMSAFFTSLMH
jgi:hypothetical protein